MKVSAAAASTPSRRKHHEEVSKSLQTLKAHRSRRRDRAETVFAKLCDCNGMLPENKLQLFLARVVCLPEDKLEPNAKKLVFDTAHRQQDNGGFRKEPLLDAVKKYGEYIRQSKMVNDTYQKFQKSENEGLTRNELRYVLESYERRADRLVHGMQLSLFITDDDLDFIFL